MPARAVAARLADFGAWPLGYLKTYGPRADPATALTWGLLYISIAVVVIVTVLVVIGVVLRQAPPASAGGPVVEAAKAAHGWLWIGMGLTLLALVFALIWTVRVVAQIDSPAVRPAFTLEVDARQWWWRARYDAPAGRFDTANEIHVPVGRPVLVKLTSPDVIHSFWVPALTGKTETIPGRTNLSWMQADRAGVFRGQCTEYCGVQHAKMALIVVAEPQGQFDAWAAAQRAPAAAPQTAEAARGEAVFQAHCGACHVVRGGPGHGGAGPDLTHLMSRSELAAGALPNTVGALSGWIADPQSVKPGARMPATGLSGPDLGAVVAYLETLK